MVCALVGMSGLAVAIVGGPLTMAFLALETTGSLPLTVAVVGAAVVSALTVRRTFGYSLRDLALPSARRGDPQRRRYRLDAQPDGRADDAPRGAHGARRHHRWPRSAATCRWAPPLAWWWWTRPTATPASCWCPRRTRPKQGRPDLADLLHHQNDVLLPQMTIKDAVATFEQAEADALAVVDGTDSRRVIGLLTEAVRAAPLQRGTRPAAAGAVRGVA